MLSESVQTARAFLSGGPPDIPRQQRVVDAVESGDKIVVPNGNGYEHFSRTEEFREVDGDQLAVFQWLYRTKIAE